MDEKDYEIWDLRKFFSIREAAALWCDVNPANASEMAKTSTGVASTPFTNLFNAWRSAESPGVGGDKPLPYKERIGNGFSRVMGSIIGNAGIK